MVAERVYDRLVTKGYIDDEKFARYWVENRNLTKGSSKRKLVAELRAKGVEQSIIDGALEKSSRSDNDELRKVLAKKRTKYDDEQKLIAYLARQGFSYDDIKSALSELD
jgi:regulatory protein